MAYSDISDPKVETIESNDQTAPVTDVAGAADVAESLRDRIGCLDGDERSRISALDRTQQELIVDALDIVDPIVERTDATHTPAYYCAMFIDDMPTLDGMSDEAKDLAAIIAVKGYRASASSEQPEADQPEGASGVVIGGRAGDVTVIDIPKDAHHGTERTDDAADSASAERSGEMEPDREMTVEGCDHHLYRGHLSADGTVTLEVIQFGRGEYVLLLEFDSADVSNPNYLQADLAEASQDWDGDALESALGPIDADELFIEAASALNYLSKHMLAYGDAVMLDHSIRRVVGCRGMEDPERAAAKAKAKAAEDAQRKTMEEAERLGYTMGDVIGAWGSVGGDWERVIDYLNDIYRASSSEDPTTDEVPTDGEQAEA